MRAEVRRFHSPDIDFDLYVPGQPHHFAFLLQVMAAPAGSEGEESFDVVVCTPSWLAEQLEREPVFVGRHHLIVSRFDAEMIKKAIRGYVEELEAPDWQGLAVEIGRLGKWEFDDYVD